MESKKKGSSPISLDFQEDARALSRSRKLPSIETY
jgi:hypothetical protein